MSGPAFNLLGSALLALFFLGVAVFGYRLAQSDISGTSETGSALAVVGVVAWITIGVPLLARAWSDYAHTLGGFVK